MLPLVYFFAKLLIFLFMFVWFRATLPRFRYDQLMDLGWKFLIPLALGWFLLLTSVLVADDVGWNPVLTGGVTALILVVGGLMLRASIKASAARHQLSDSLAADDGVPAGGGA